MFGWFEKKKADREYLDYLNSMTSFAEILMSPPRDKIKKPEYYVDAMKNDVRFYHVQDKTKCRIISIDRRCGQDDCDIVMECRVGYLRFKYRLSSLEFPLVFKEII